MAIIDHLSEPACQGDKWPCEGLGAWGWLSCDADELAASFHLWAKAGEAKAITKGLLTKRVAVGTAVDGKSIMPHITHMIRLCAHRAGSAAAASKASAAGPARHGFKASKSARSWLNAGHQKPRVPPGATDSHKSPS